MNEIASITLENEMDVILAHKQSMRLAELVGLPLSAQTTFATAISEVSRTAFDEQNSACLTLYISEKRDKVKFITATLEDRRKGSTRQKDEGYLYAQRLVSNISTETTLTGSKTELKFRLPSALRIDDSLIEKLRINLNNDPAVSPYEEIKRKNRQLVEMADRLRESEQQYRSLTDSLPVLIFSMNRDGSIVYANQWLYSYTGHTYKEINESKWNTIVHAEDADEVWNKWKRLSNDANAIMTPELRIRDVKTGEYRWHTGISIPVLNDDGNVNIWNSFLVDIHDKKLIAQTLKDNRELQQIQGELEEKIDLLNQSNQQLEQFAYIASHDLQEPLRKISFYSDFLNNKFKNDLPEQAVPVFENLISASTRMKVLVQDILAYSTVRQEPFMLVALNDILADVVTDLELAIKEKNAKIVIENLPEIEGNSRQLKQLFENLLSNAIKFSSSDKQPEVHISSTLNKESAIIYVKDNGIGFDEQYIDKMFNLFQRLHSREKYSGTGIGLAICKKIVDTHMGTITASGEINKGSTFVITLPLRQIR